MWGLWIGLLLLSAQTPVLAAVWSLEGSLGTAHNFGTRLRIEQEGQEPLRISGRYSTQALDSPQYYGIRVSRWIGERAWELSLIHDKLYLRSPPSPVESLSISHGFNLLTLNRAVQTPVLTYRLGAGVAVTHLEGHVRGVVYDGPYDLAGLTLLAGVSKRFYWNREWFLVGDAAVNLAYANAQAGGDPKLTVTLPQAAVHALLGVGRDF
jgi:hypothetical protein